MSRASNSLTTFDVITTPIKLKYSASYLSGSVNEAGIELLTGVNYPVYFDGAPSQEVLLYRSTRHLYYSNYLTGSYQVSASYTENWLQSTAASGTIEQDRRVFPTGSGEVVGIISVPREAFGEKIARRSFRLESENYDLVDDGNGNIWDAATAPGYFRPLFFNRPDLFFTQPKPYEGVQVGNILYAQGLIIITNQNYRRILFNYDFLLTENGDFILTETSDRIIIT
jgi:hypothetical protein